MSEEGSTRVSSHDGVASPWGRATNLGSSLPDGMLDQFLEEWFSSNPANEGEDPHAGHPAEVRGFEGHDNVSEYRYHGHRIIAKVYAADREQEGLWAYRIWRTLWSQGFGPGSVHRIPEPLAYLSDRRTLLLEAAPGDRLRTLVRDGWELRDDGLRSAARWLADLHSFPVRVGPPGDQRRGIHRLAAKASARHPELEDTVTELVRELGRRVEMLSSRGPPQPFVQTHGRYHSGHVFLSSDTVTVIDLDRAAPSDPAKDVAEFLSRHRREVSRKGPADHVAERDTHTFLSEYQRCSPVRLSGLLHYWSLSVLTTLLHHIYKHRVDEETWKTQVEFLESEFRSLPRRVAEYGWPG